MFILSTSALLTSKQNFVSKLKRHLYLRFQRRRSQDLDSGGGSGANETPVSNEANTIVFQGQRIFRHKLLYLNYTTYDIRQDQDIVNPNSERRDVVFLRASAPTDKASDHHHHAYGRVLGIFHANVYLPGSEPSTQHWERFDFLWIRWFKPLQSERSWSAKRLDALTFPALSDPDSVTFVDPADVLRACHIIPRFSRGPAQMSQADLSICADNQNDWKQYMVNRYVYRAFFDVSC